MKLGKEWTEKERLYVCGSIGLEMLRKRNTKNWVPIEDVLEWAERLIFATKLPAEFLEANRENIIAGFSNIKRASDD